MLDKQNEPTQSELTLRAMWDEMGIPLPKQDEILAEIDARAQPGAMVGPFVIWREPEDQAEEIAMLKSQLADVRYCPDCQNVITPQDRGRNVYYCGMCDKNLLQHQVDRYKGETRGKDGSKITQDGGSGPPAC